MTLQAEGPRRMHIKAWLDAVTPMLRPCNVWSPALTGLGGVTGHAGLLLGEPTGQACTVLMHAEFSAQTVFGGLAFQLSACTQYHSLCCIVIIRFECIMIPYVQQATRHRASDVISCLAQWLKGHCSIPPL